MTNIEKPAYYVDLNLGWNRDHIEKAKLGEPIDVLVRSDLERQADPIKAKGVRAVDKSAVTVEFGNYTQTHDRHWETLMHAIAEARRRAQRAT